MRKHYTIIVLTICVLFVFTNGNNAFAQTLDSVLLEAPKPLGDIRTIRRDPDPSSLKVVSERLDSDLRPVAIRWRGLEIYPLLKTTVKYVDNVFATEKNTKNDVITTINPSIFFFKEYGRHNFGFLLEGDAHKYADNTDEDKMNFKTKLNGVLEARHDITFPFEVSYIIGHEKREQNFANNFSKDPIKFKSFGSALGISYNPNRLNLSLTGRYNNISFEDGENKSGQAVIRSDSDRSFVEAEARVSYDLLPNHKPFVSVSLNDTNYARGDFQGGSFSGPKRDSKGVGFLAGWEFVYKGLVEGYLGAGYSEKDYKDNAIDDVSSSRVAGNISWNVSKKATLKLALRRKIAEDNQILAAAILSQGRLEFDYEFLHNLFFDAFVDRALANFQDSDREDNLLSVGTGLRYIINPRYSVSGHYNFKARESNLPGLDYDRHQFMVRLNTRI